MNDLERMDGLFVGSLGDYEMWLFEHAVTDGMAWNTWRGLFALPEAA